MEQQVIFRDFQEQTASDHNNTQSFARQSFDHVINDAITKSNRFAGFNVIKTAQTEVQVSAGRLYDQNGAVFSRNVTVTQSMTPYLAAAAQRIITVSVYGQEIETDIQERDFLVNVETGATQPDAVAMQRARSAELVFTSGAESADPQPAPIPSTHAVIAHILVDTLQVVSITMVADNMVVSTEGLNARTKSLEAFRDQIEPRVTSIASDLSSLSSQVENASTQRDLLKLYQDFDELKRRLDVPALATDSFTDKFTSEDFSDVEDAGGLGYDAKVDAGLRFPMANMSIKAINIFSANDPNATLSNGMLLPRFKNELKISTGEYHSDIGIAQYGFQTTEVVQKTITKTRLRYGPYWAWYYPYYYYAPYYAVWGDGSVYAGILRPRAYIAYRYWYETYEETYSTTEVINHSISGALVGQTFLNANDLWATQLGFYVTSKAAASDIWVTLCEVTNGMPDKDKAILVQAYPHASIVSGWNVMNIPPTFLESGKRYAVVFVSDANHRFGMSSGQSYIDGTFFYSTDGEYFLGDLTKDLMIQVIGAKFDNAQVAIELEALNLDGGIDSIDLETPMVSPASTNLVFEVQPNGTGAWFPLNETNVDAFNGMPPLCRFRARFVGTRDMHTGFKLTGSEVRLTRPKTSMKHVSKTVTLSSASDEIRVRVVVEGYDPLVHTLDCKLRVGSTTEDADVSEFILRDEDAKRYEATFKFDLSVGTTDCRVILLGGSTSAANLFHIDERLLWAM